MGLIKKEMKVSGYVGFRECYRYLYCIGAAQRVFPSRQIYFRILELENRLRTLPATERVTDDLIARNMYDV